MRFLQISRFANEKTPNMNEKMPNKGAGKGDKPRSCFSHRFKENYDTISWKEDQKSLIKKELKKQNGSSTYIYK